MNTLTIVPYERRFREDILNLMFYSRWTHTHLDWYRAGRWLDVPNIIVRLAWHGEELVGFIGAAVPLNGACWLRLMAVHNAAVPAETLTALWHNISPVLVSEGAKSASILAINRWLLDILPDLAFQPLEQVVTLQRSLAELPQLTATRVTLRQAYIEDLPQIEMIDHAAFAPPWQMTTDELRQAQRQAASATVAEVDDTPIGYQISTRHHTSGHLARLAVMPELQGQGVGAALLHDMLARFSRRGVRSVTVNTQESNVRSQRLYEWFGFRRNGFDLPVWTTALA